MENQSIHKIRGLSIFQRLFISYLGAGLVIFAVFGFVYYQSEKKYLQTELKVQLDHALKIAVRYFDQTYTVPIDQDLNYIERSYAFSVFLSSSDTESTFVRPLVEQLFLNFTDRPKGMYLSARFIDAKGIERVVTSGNKRVRGHLLREDVSQPPFYPYVHTLFQRLKSAQVGSILFEGPFNYDNRPTFLIGISKSDPEVGGFAGGVIFRCDLTNYFDYLDKFVFYKEHVAQVLSLDNKLLFAPHGKNDDSAIGSKSPVFYTVSDIVRMGTDHKPFFKIKFEVSSDVLHYHMKEAFRYSLAWALAIVFFIAVFAFFISKYFSRPLIDLTKCVDQFAKGNFSARAKIKASGEMGVLIESFNRMAEDMLKVTVSRDDLIKEIDKRKRTEEELRKAYEELKSIHAQLVQAEKMASVGQLAAGVAHEINNPVGFISNNMEMLGQYVSDYNKVLRMVEGLKKSVEEGNSEKAKAIIKDINQFEQEIQLAHMINDTDSLLKHNQVGIERIRKIIMDLRTFAREDSNVTELVKIEEVIDSILSIVYNELKYKAELKKNYGQTPLVKCNTQRLGQVFVNLLVNAVHAIEEKGTIEIKTYQEGKYLCVDVSDTGKGIPPENLKKIFDPFFTTKPIGEGTGLGLSVSYEIVKKHGGYINVQSTVGKGTTFTVMLPVI